MAKNHQRNRMSEVGHMYARERIHSSLIKSGQNKLYNVIFGIVVVFLSLSRSLRLRCSHSLDATSNFRF